MGSADRSPHGDDDGDDRRSEPRPVLECDGAAVDLAPVYTGGPDATGGYGHRRRASANGDLKELRGGRSGNGF